MTCDPAHTWCPWCPCVFEDGSRLRELVALFAGEMVTKFWARRHKHPRSVTLPDFDWSTELDVAEIEAHLREEISEWLEDGADRQKEDVDLANMAFLDWAVRRSRRPPPYQGRPDQGGYPD